MPLLLALMMLGDARAAEFTTQTALKDAVNACLSVSPQGNCCAPKDSVDPTNIKLGIVDRIEGNCADGDTHLQHWDVSSVTNMSESKLLCFTSPFRALCAVLQGVCSCDLTLCFLVSFVRFFPSRTVFSGTYYFNQDLSDWDVSSVTNMRSSKLLSFTSPFRALCAVLQGVCSCDLTLCFLVSFVRFFTSRTVFSSADAFDQILCGPSWVVSEAAFAAGTSLFAGDNAGVTTFSSIASSACCPAGTYWIVEDPADCKTWDGIRKEIREEILSDEQDILQALAARQSCSS